MESDSLEDFEQNTTQEQPTAPNGNGVDPETLTPEMMEDGVRVNENGDIVLPEVP